MMSKTDIANRFRSVQNHICQELEQLDGIERFQTDEWQRAEGGGGLTCTLKGGQLIEKGGVAFSEVFGEVSEVMNKQLGLNGQTFFATGVSIVIHPVNPYVPIIHMNVRYFEMDTGERWFGGGIDLTPHYINAVNAGIFHGRLKNICDRYDNGFYGRFKDWADDYFFLSHRNETRGVGGIFFDHLMPDERHNSDTLFQFCYELAHSFPSIYAEQVTDRDRPYGKKEKAWQHLRRGRYVEFNLVHDRGTKFGLLSGGRTESILMSLPPLAEWEYNHQIESGSEEEQTQHWLRKGVDWMNVG